MARDWMNGCDKFCRMSDEPQQLGRRLASSRVPSNRPPVLESTRQCFEEERAKWKEYTWIRLEVKSDFITTRLLGTLFADVSFISAFWGEEPLPHRC